MGAHGMTLEDAHTLAMVYGVGPLAPLYPVSPFPGLLAVNVGAEEAERRAREHPSRQVLRAILRNDRKAQRTARNAMYTAPWGRKGPPVGCYRYQP